ncbi:hypothetical protein [Amycolatopsis taiwanensis]|uniref:hypothetical protein n=1 Tax=Amycolatopsis taiwanensis TaxID=342230 RepID=UPI0012EB6ED7|nr:hypothetical protein [Amycolatopsis taiwanensis]
MTGFERRYGITLPASYRAVVTEVGAVTGTWCGWTKNDRRSTRRHLDKAGFIPIDLDVLTVEQQGKVREYSHSLRHKCLFWSDVSWIFVLHTGRADEREHVVFWDSGPVRWVVEQVGVTVTDEYLKAGIRRHQESGERMFAVSDFPEPQIEQAVAVILGPLLSAARREWPPDNDPYGMTSAIEELVDLTREWLAGVNAQRRAEGRPEFHPSLDR